MEIEPAEFVPPTPYTTDLAALEKRLGELHEKYCLPYNGSIFGWAASVVRDHRQAQEQALRRVGDGLNDIAKAGLERIIAKANASHIEGRKEAGVLREPEF